ncbi:serine hydrolase domain-containing protein, partial [Robiginitalea sp.]|uniref:serine hydrolase domain-containing protein n=1 Tax=Robiginitalea sp. TaxID=1902411 RepID=UPI003C580481
MRTLLFVLILTSFACKQQAEAPMEKAPALQVADGFQPARFTTDERTAQIASIGPKLHEVFETYAREKNIPGIAYGIVVDGQLVIDSALGYSNLEKQIPARTTSQFRIASMTKSFTAMGIMKLVEDGALSLHDPAYLYVPEMRDIRYLTSDATHINIENLLTMTAGFPEDNPWGDRQLDETDQMLRDLLKANPSFSNPPSFAFEYSNTGYAILGLIITKITGMPYQEYIDKNILAELQMEDTYWEFEDITEERRVIGYNPDSLTVAPMLHDGTYGAMGGLITSIEDFSKYVSFHLSAWPPRNDPEVGPVRRSTLRKMQQPQFSRLYADAKDWNDNPCPVISGYGYGLGISENCEGIRRISHGGALPGFGSNYVFYPDLGIGLMAFCNVTYTTPWPYGEISKLLFEELDLKPRKLPVSSILNLRKNQIVEWFNTWDPELEAEVFAENFYLDSDRKTRLAALRPLLEGAGEIQEIGEINPGNQLRGSFEIIGNKDTVNIYFTLSPEADPKIQALYA